VIRTSDREAYHRYVDATGGTDYASTPGNLGFQMLFRDRGDGTTEVTTLSWWQDLAAIHGFAGEDIEVARYYPEDDRYLIERPQHVEHHEVVARGGSAGG
jgi:heme-degrading monooxygenase HmoA